MTINALPPIENADLVDQVYDRILNAIQEGALPPGERLVERDLAERLGVSRAPVRDALIRLEQGGLVASAGRRGREVSVLSANDAWEVYTLRAALEGMAARIAATVRDPDAVASLEAIVSEMRDKAQGTEIRTLAALDKRFHETMCRAAGNARLVRAWVAMSDQIRLLLQIDAQVADAQYGEPSQLPDRHARLLDAVRAGDPDAAENAVRSHIDAVAERVVRTLREAEQRRTGVAAAASPNDSTTPHGTRSRLSWTTSDRS